MPSTTALYSAKVKPSTMIEAYYDNKHERDGLAVRTLILSLVSIVSIVAFIIASRVADRWTALNVVLLVIGLASYAMFVLHQNRLDKRQRKHDYYAGWLTSRGFKNFVM